MNRLHQIRRPLLKWYDDTHRDLPWRRTRDPYAVWVSEVMLQQTRVQTVIPYYERVLARWPTVEALAAADPEAVRAAWSGLGYYRRAHLMQKAANAIVTEHDGALPDEPDALQRLPGFGRYTAGAVASLAFDRAVPAVDGNAARVIVRLEGIRGDVSRSPGQTAIWAAAEAQVQPAGRAAGQLNQALMELGARVCKPRAPDCGGCPVAAPCVAHREGLVDEIPAPKRRAPRKAVPLTALIVLAPERRVVLERRPERGVLARLWTPPLLEGHLGPTEATDASALRWGWTLDQARDAGRLEHVLTHRDLLIRLVTAETVRPEVPEGLRPVALDRLDTLGIPSVTSRALRQALPAPVLDGAKLPGRARIFGE